MKKIMFVCYGNICRSPMAEFLMKELVRDNGLEQEFYIASAATSTEELGHPVHRGTAKILSRMGIDFSAKRAVQLKRADYENYHYFIGMDDMNVRDMKRIFGQDGDKRIFKLMDFTATPKDVADPWWTGDFEQTFTDIVNGLNGLMKKLLEEQER